MPNADDAGIKPLVDADHRPGIRAVSAYRIAGSGQPPRREECLVVEEDVLSIDVEDIGAYSLMWTPTEVMGDAVGYTSFDGVLAQSENPEALALAAGFCFTEGLIAGMQDVRSIAMCAELPGVVRVQLLDPSRVTPRRRNVVVASSCGVCGGREMIESSAADLPAVPKTLQLRGDQLGLLMETMRERQAVYQNTGGAHAAAVFSPGGEILAAAEDLGRHNALDKVIGICLLKNVKTDGCGVLLSSRLSFEMVVKAARAKFELIAAVSAPTSIAIEVANRCGITLCGFVRGESATIYTHPERVAEVGSIPAS
jgi:FdhD protein